jgi:hypothetical protein
MTRMVRWLGGGLFHSPPPTRRFLRNLNHRQRPFLISSSFLCNIYVPLQSEPKTQTQLRCVHRRRISSEYSREEEELQYIRRHYRRHGDSDDAHTPPPHRETHQRPFRLFKWIHTRQWPSIANTGIVSRTNTRIRSLPGGRSDDTAGKWPPKSPVTCFCKTSPVSTSTTVCTRRPPTVSSPTTCSNPLAPAHSSFSTHRHTDTHITTRHS